MGGTTRENAMTESEWLACADPMLMLEFLIGPAEETFIVSAGDAVPWVDYPNKRISKRKERLFACACCRRIWHLLTGERSRIARKALATAELYAEGGSRRMMEEAHWLVNAVWVPRDVGLDAMAAFHFATLAGSHIADATCREAHNAIYRESACSGEIESGLQCDVLRDIVGPLPFRQVTAVPLWLVWNNGTVRRIAEVIYAERQLPEGTFDNARLAILADALEEAGCHDAEILAHCRSEGPH